MKQWFVLARLALRSFRDRQRSLWERLKKRSPAAAAEPNAQWSEIAARWRPPEEDRVREALDRRLPSGASAIAVVLQGDGKAPTIRLIANQDR